MTSKQICLSIEKLSGKARNGARPLFDGLDLAVEYGESVVICGASGSGKSTLLQMVLDGVQSNASGKITVNKRQTAMVYQEGALLDYLNVQQNIDLVKRFSTRKSLLGATDVIAEIGLSESLLARPVSTLSGGQKRRVAIARALVREPELFLFDEPDTGMDLAALKDVAVAVSDRVTSKTAAVTVSHNPYYIAQIATRVLELRDGKLTELFNWGTLVAGEAADSESEFESRYQALTQALGQMPVPIEDAYTQVSLIDRLLPTMWLAGLSQWLFGGAKCLQSVLKLTPSSRDFVSIFSRTFWQTCLSGSLFYLLVGTTLGATTIAVVRTLADNALTGIIGMLLPPVRLLEMMGGAYVVFLAPAVASMLFVARSGSICSGWLGELQRGGQIRALDSLGVDPDKYLRFPVTLSVFAACVVTITIFAAGVWGGSLLSAKYLFGVVEPWQILSVSGGDLQVSQFWLKTVLYSTFTALTITGLGLAPKVSGEQVARDTTRVIIYATVSASVAELLFALI
ncbi:MAG: ATP-binding cassette domain-containing protein [Proteobacteria bacterium]|jgi:ABC-type multidrug transport system ATPase subunit/ABC-type transporter Mla maintaining outer membrane lipid asymmetry permease subunit MlaE|nr:ATP-binding cassette domain-containing protein [Pseudomonadota bacterium]